MKYLSVSEFAKQWNVSERSVHNYCAQGRIQGAKLVGKTWNIPQDATKTERKKNTKHPNALLAILKDEKQSQYSGEIYHKTQIELTYNSITWKVVNYLTTKQGISLKQTRLD